MKQMKKMMMRTALVAAVLGGAFLTFGCGDSAPSSGDGNKTITIAAPVDINTLDPRNGSGTITTNVMSYIYDSLLRTDENGKITPYLAESYKQIDGTTWEFKLKKDAKFSDGTPLTAEDVKYTVDSFKDPSKNFKLASDYKFMDIEIKDPQTFVIKLQKPFQSLPLRLTCMSILPKGYLEKVGDEEFAKKPIGSGPYKVQEWTKDNQIVLVKNENYYGTKPKADKVVFKIIPEAASRMAALESHEVDIISGVQTSEVERLKGVSGIKVVGGPTTRVIFLGMNLKTDTPLKDKKVRQALNYAVNKEEIIKGVLDGNATPIPTIATPQYEFYDKDIKPYEYNPEKAKELLKEAGYPDGFDIQMSLTESYMNGQDVAQAISGQLEKVGVRVTPVMEASNGRTPKFKSATILPLYMMGIGGPYSDIDLVSKISFSSGERYSTWSDPQFDALREKAEETIDPAEAQLAWSALQNYIKEEAPAVFLYQQHMIYAYNADRLSGFKPHQDEHIMVNDVDVK